MEVIKTAIIGFGAIGKRYYSLLRSMPQFAVVAIVDKCEAVVDDVTWYVSIDALCKQIVDLKLVIVCTPNGYHAVQAQHALSRGCAVVCEKPLALTADDARMLIHSSQLYNSPLFCVMQNRFSPAVQWLKQLVASGRLGQIFMLQVNCWWNRSDEYYGASSWRGTRSLDGGVLFTQFSHFVDLIIWLFGAMNVNYATMSNYSHLLSTEIADSGTVFFTLGEGSSGVLSFTTAVPHQNFESSLTIIARNGCVVLGGQYMDSITRCTIPDTVVPDFEVGQSNHCQLIAAVSDSLLHAKPFPIASSDALLVVETIEDIYKKAISI